MPAPGDGRVEDRENLGDHPHPVWSTADPQPVSSTTDSRATVGVAVVATVVFLTAIAPLATDIYVPAFPAVAAELSATATQVQLTLTTFFVGMALGQLVGGPVSDQRGRRTPLLAAIVAITAASAVCALPPASGSWPVLVWSRVSPVAGPWSSVGP
jgi:DHA1 family bicyclomycin/chloramphenicol resistance-like MFS transporter